MPESTRVVKPSLSFAKLVATPSDRAWSQAYNAGNLFACLSLTIVAADESVSLQAIGKDIFNLLQSEFFVLEDKTPETIKNAITQSMTKLPSSVTVDLTLANFKDETLTVFIAGSGKIVMKRDEKIGVLLEKNREYNGDITSASGILQNTDMLVLQTGQFAKGIPHETVVNALNLELPNDMVESLSPQVHEQDNGAQSAIVIRFNMTSLHPETTNELATDEEIDEQSVVNSVLSPDLEIADEERVKKPFSVKLPAMPTFPKLNIELTHRRKLFLSIAIILLILLGASVFFTIKKQNDENRQALFKEIYAAAQQQYEAGQGLESLNPELSRDNYLKAESKLKEGEAKIAKGTEEYTQIEALLVKVSSVLNKTTSSNEKVATLKEVEASENSLLAVVKQNQSARGFGQDASTVYFITANAITSVRKDNGNKKETIKNDDGWKSAQAIIPYQANLYVLDQKNGIVKYTAGESNYSKSNYFTGSPPNLAQVTGMAIDGSVWIVGNDGKVLKFTRGEKDTFTLSGLDKPLNKPTKIVTEITMANIYILDNGNSRIVQIDKKGVFQKEYLGAEIAKAKEFEVDQKNNRILLFSNNKVYELPL